MNKSDIEILDKLQNLDTIRKQAGRLLTLAQNEKIEHFYLIEDQMPITASFVSEVIKTNYPNLDIPYHSRWRHFEKANHEVFTKFKAVMMTFPFREQGAILFELAIISVILDAGAGQTWSYHDQSSDQTYTRSEGLALAVFNMYINGAFSEEKENSWRVDGNRLYQFTADDLKSGLQISSSNPIDGFEGRLSLLKRLGKELIVNNDYFGDERRLGHLYSFIIQQNHSQEISVRFLFQTLLQALSPIWPNGCHYKGVPIGDVWIYPPLKNQEPGSEYIPFHKLTQWLTYSLLEPLQWTGYTIKDMEALTALPEYRNGGLFIDMGVLKIRDPNILKIPQTPSSEAIIEWRGLTIALMDKLADLIRIELKMDKEKLPLAKILQGGTWEAGRIIAGKRRNKGTPPIQILSNGTVF